MVRTLKYDQLLALGYERATTRTAEGSRLDLSDFADYFEIDDKTSTPFNPAPFWVTEKAATSSGSARTT